MSVSILTSLSFRYIQRTSPTYDFYFPLDECSSEGHCTLYKNDLNTDPTVHTSRISHSTLILEHLYTLVPRFFIFIFTESLWRYGIYEILYSPNVSPFTKGGSYPLWTLLLLNWESHWWQPFLKVEGLTLKVWWRVSELPEDDGTTVP